jgi:hypothetical protein
LHESDFASFLFSLDSLRCVKNICGETFMSLVCILYMLCLVCGSLFYPLLVIVNVLYYDSNIRNLIKLH